MDQMQEDFFQQLYETWFPKLCHYAASVVKDPHVAEEIVQDTFLAALGKLEGLSQAENPERWLLKTAKNKTLHYFRAQATRRKRLLSLEAEGIDPASPNAAILALEEAQQDTLEETYALIRTVLKPEELLLLHRIAIEGKSYHDTAAELGCSLWACQKRMQRIRKKLQPALAQQHREDGTAPAEHEGKEAKERWNPPPENARTRPQRNDHNRVICCFTGGSPQPRGK